MLIRHDLGQAVYNAFVSHKIDTDRQKNRDLIDDTMEGAQRIMDRMTGGDSFGSGHPGEVWVPLTPTERAIVTQSLVAAGVDSHQGLNQARKSLVKKVSTTGVRKDGLWVDPESTVSYR